MSFRAYDLLNLVGEHGQTLTLRNKTYGSYDVTTSTVSSTTSDDYSFTGYFYNYSLGVIDPENINRGVRKCVIPALGLTVAPDTEDEIIGNGNKVHINNVLTMFSGGTALCYICDVSE